MFALSVNNLPSQAKLGEIKEVHLTTIIEIAVAVSKPIFTHFQQVVQLDKTIAINIGCHRPAEKGGVSNLKIVKIGISRA